MINNDVFNEVKFLPSRCLLKSETTVHNEDFATNRLFIMLNVFLAYVLQ